MRIFRFTRGERVSSIVVPILSPILLALVARPAMAQETLPTLPPPAATSQSSPAPPSSPATSISPPSAPSYAPPADSLPPPTAPSPPVQDATRAPAAAKRLGLGADALLLVPFGTLADATGVLVGPLLRVGYHLTPRLELTFRAGYLIGFDRSHGDGEASTNETVIPLWLGGRYFVLGERSGLYAAGEVGLNLLQVHINTDNIPTEAAGVRLVRGRGGFDAGVGYVLSEKLPIDFRVQFTYLNLLGAEANDDPFVGLAFGVGYTFSF